MGRPIARPFLQVDTGLTRDDVFLAFAAALRPSLPEALQPAWVAQAFLHLVNAWESCLLAGRAAFPLETPPEIIDQWAGFHGKPGAFAACFRTYWCDHRDGVLVPRGFAERYGALAARREKDRDRKRLAAERARREAARQGSLAFLDVDFEDEDDGNSTGNTGIVRAVSGGNGTVSVPKILEGREELQEPLSPDGDSGTPSVHASPAVSAGNAEGAVATAVRPQRPRTTRATAAAPKPEPKWPHFPMDTRRAIGERLARSLHRDLTSAEIARCNKAFAERWFTKPEADRGADRPSDAEVVQAVDEILSAADAAENGHWMRKPELLAEEIGRVTLVLRECANDPLERMERVERALNLRVRRPVGRT